MNPEDYEKILVEFNGNPPADMSAVHKFEQEAGFRLPESYVQFLLRANGGKGFIGPAFVVFWRVGELLENNRGYEAVENVPELFLFGSDGGGEAFAFNISNGGTPIVMVPFIGMELDEACPLGATFDAFLETLYLDGVSRALNQLHVRHRGSNKRKPKKQSV